MLLRLTNYNGSGPVSDMVRKRVPKSPPMPARNSPLAKLLTIEDAVLVIFKFLGRDGLKAIRIFRKTSRM
jgi:hypothetical protein